MVESGFRCWWFDFIVLVERDGNGVFFEEVVVLWDGIGRCRGVRFGLRFIFFDGGGWVVVRES